jgi:hypothetical protein
MAIAAEVASWMATEVGNRPRLYQRTAVREIKAKFGEEFVYRNKNGNLAIAKEVLDEFNTLTTDTVVWSIGSRYWRLRRAEDSPGRGVK